MQYEIKGAPFPALICHLDDGEQMITEGGGMSWMTPNMVMETTTNGGLGKAIGRLLAKDKMFQNRYTCRGGKGMISFTSCRPGNIRAIEIHPGEQIICQKSAFLASTPGVNMSVYFKKSLGTGLFGGEGFIMQRLSGQGMAFVEIDGELVEYELAAGQQLVVDTGNVAGFETSVSIDIQQVPGLKNKVLGGEGFFNTLLTGPGKVWLQTMPLSSLASALRGFIPSGN